LYIRPTGRFSGKFDRIVLEKKMVRQPRRLLWRLLMAFLLIAGSDTLRGQTESAPNNTTNKPDPDAILHELAPDTTPLDELKPNPTQRERAIHLLLAIKHNEAGKNRQLAIFLLASLGHEYEQNRNALLQIWQGCVVPTQGGNCDEDTAQLLVALYRQGHREVLQPLLAGCRNSDGALSEELYSFYSDVLEDTPSKFLIALSSFKFREQERICESAGDAIAEEAGGGPMDGTDPANLRGVLTALRRNKTETATRCLQALRIGYNEGVQGIIEEEKGAKSQ
jgi:hypothetical protein